MTPKWLQFVAAVAIAVAVAGGALCASAPARTPGEATFEYVVEAYVAEGNSPLSRSDYLLGVDTGL
jgi:hypothetical protein